MKQRKLLNFSRPLALLLALALCLTLAEPALAAEDATASSIQLAKTEGTVSATNSAGRNISLIKNLRLFSGYHVVTKEESYAWLKLDSSKLLKEDASSETEVRKNGKKLEVLLHSGNLFFNVTEPLEDDETLNIRTSTLLTGVRGTCGWVEVIDRWNSRVCILEGKVECVVSDPVSGENELITISAGETATFTVRPEEVSAPEEEWYEITKERCDVGDVPGYVLVELAEDEALCQDIQDASGLDILGNLSQNGDPAAEARRRLAEEEAAAASRQSAINTQQQAQANNVENAPNVAGDWTWRFDEKSKTLYIEGSGAMDDFSSNASPWYAQYRHEIQSIVINEGITRIGNRAFNNCSKLTSIAIPSSMTGIGNRAFADCTGLTSITIPSTVTSIEAYAFTGCTGLTSITIPNSVTSMGECVFYGCTNLTSITLQDGMTSIGNRAFSNCYGLTSITIPDSVSSIGQYAFNGCNKLTSIAIPSSMTGIGNRAFADCTGLTSITIPSTVTGIEAYAFNGCTSLTDVYYSGSETQWNAINISSTGNAPLTGAIIHYDS